MLAGDDAMLGRLYDHALRQELHDSAVTLFTFHLCAGDQFHHGIESVTEPADFIVAPLT